MEAASFSEKVILYLELKWTLCLGWESTRYVNRVSTLSILCVRGSTCHQYGMPRHCIHSSFFCTQIAVARLFQGAVFFDNRSRAFYWISVCLYENSHVHATSRLA